MATADEGTSSAVILHEEGIIGCYNRGNRTTNHLIENCLPILISLPVTFYVFPFPSAVCLIIYSFGRVIYQLGYAVIGFEGRAPGFMIDRFSMFTMLGLVLIAGIKMA